ncbi:MAG: sigma-54 dependent transcriptional regulator [Gemmatimonadales bacterium]
MSTILLIDDVVPLAEQYAYDLRRLGGFDVVVANTGADGLEIVAKEPVDCVILDLEMPGMDGFDVLRALAEMGSDVPVIVYTGTGSYDRCIQAVRIGATGFIDKAEPMERVALEVTRAVEQSALRREVAMLRARTGQGTLVGTSAPMRKLRDMIQKVAPVPSGVLIVGESGTGKELVARELHRASGRSSEPFLAINCAALPEQLVESELFGHEKGAFTGAQQLRRGAFEAAGAGTLFLDEIGELPLAAQAKLLRVLEQREVTRVGGTRTVAVHARVLAATNRNLEDEVAAKRFRQDLYYRVHVHQLAVPSLRERISDVPLLAEHLLAQLAPRLGHRPPALTQELLDRWMAQSWERNNVRELRNVLERWLITGEDGLSAAPRGAVGGSWQDQKVEAERQIVMRALEAHEWQIGKTAEALGLSDHASLLKIMRRLGVERE